MPRDYITLGNGLIALVDPDIAEKWGRYRWRYKKSSSRSYVVRKALKYGREVTLRLHREIMNCPIGLEVHHKDTNPLNNKRYNLQIVTSSEHHMLHKKNFMKIA